MTGLKFRQCPKEPRLYQQLSVWAWLLVAVGGMLLLLLILGGVLTLIRSSQRVSTQIRKSIPETNHIDDEGNIKTFKISPQFYLFSASKNTSSRDDSAREPVTFI